MSFPHFRSGGAVVPPPPPVGGLDVVGGGGAAATAGFSETSLNSLLKGFPGSIVIESLCDTYPFFETSTLYDPGASMMGFVRSSIFWPSIAISPHAGEHLIFASTGGGAASAVAAGSGVGAGVGVGAAVGAPVVAGVPDVAFTAMGPASVVAPPLPIASHAATPPPTSSTATRPTRIGASLPDAERCGGIPVGGFGCTAGVDDGIVAV